VFDAVAEYFMGTEPPECDHPGCIGKQFEEQEAEQSESWWEKWFRSSDNGDDGESGSSD
jgi:hypothetical protein